MVSHMEHTMTVNTNIRALQKKSVKSTSAHINLVILD